MPFPPTLGAPACSRQIFHARRFTVVGEMGSEATSAEPHAAFVTCHGVFRADARTAVGTRRDGNAPANLAPLISGVLHFEDSARFHSSASRQYPARADDCLEDQL